MAGQEGTETDGLLRAALRACRRHIGAVLLFSAALNILYLAPSVYMLQVYDRVMTSGGVWTLVFITIVLILCLATLSYLDATRSRILTAASRRLDRMVSPELMNAALTREGRAAAGPSQPLREFDTFRMALTGPPALAVIDAPWTPIYIAVCFLIHPWIGVLALVGGIILVVIAFFNENATRQPLRAYEESSAAMYQLQHNDGVFAEAVRALGMQESVVRRQLRARDSMAAAHGKAGRTGANFLAGTKFTRLFLQSAALGLGAFLAVRQDISAGGVIAGSILTARAFAPLEQIVAAWRQYPQAVRALKVVRAVLATRDSNRTYTELPAPKGALSVEQVTVRSPAGDRFLLQGVTFNIEPGEIVGVIGPSGAGKTTLMRVISGAAAPDGGTVRIDGAKLTDWPSDRLGRYLGYLPQDVALFAGTIADNISRFQRETDADADRGIVAAAEAAGVHDLILTLPKGYDTELGPAGRGLSAGQAQRVALARALYGEPALLILDEPNAHLDAEGEGALINSLKAAQAKGVGSIVVAHRAGFMSIADKLLVLRNGRIDDFGPRDKVLAKLGGGAARPVIVAGNEQAGGAP